MSRVHAAMSLTGTDLKLVPTSWSAISSRDNLINNLIDDWQEEYSFENDSSEEADIREDAACGECRDSQVTLAFVS